MKNAEFFSSPGNHWCRFLCTIDTGKSLSEALIFTSTNRQYDDKLFIELQVQHMKIPSSNLGRTCVQKLFLTFRTIFAHKMFSPCSAKRRASHKDLSVTRPESKFTSAVYAENGLVILLLFHKAFLSKAM